ncbi:PIN domain-domain-containing protein [Leucosporidium creatinivorum]|uniref:PIN domain-domain-containing protein n=1 Tax=Leucosporidium creatinivorum TaxID=106004 RepID=A0A1Y2F9B9_9BASI|nr:PIN domain-domain-containing protein [Leucosporidium creatinivorum]
MPAYADLIPQPARASSSNEPVLVTLTLGPHDLEEVLMEVEEILPPAEEVLDAVQNLRRRDELVEEEMIPWWESEGSQGDGKAKEGTVIVLDTNVLLRHLSLLQSFVILLQQHHQVTEASPPTLLIPHIVISELDGLKNSTRLADAHDSRTRASISTLARRATSWILSLISTSNPPPVRGQRKDETLLPRDATGRQVGAENNDALVLDAALWHLKDGGKAVLLTEDKNLCLRARIEGVEEAFGVKDGEDERGLLEKVDAEFARRLKERSGSQTGVASEEPHSPTRRRQGSAASSTPRRPRIDRSTSVRSPPPPQAPSHPRSTATPIPLSSSNHHLDSMELEPPADAPPLTSPPLAPTLKPIFAPSDVFFNLSEILTSFIAARLYRQVFEKLQTDRPREQARWMEELGDWRYWNAGECVTALREWWAEGGLEDVCRRGLEREPEPKGEARPPKPKPAPPSIRGTQSSRWASTPPPSRRSPSPPPAPPPLSPRASHRPRLPPSKRVVALHSFLSSLQASLLTPAAQTNNWSAPRWEVLIEGIGELLIALLGGWFDGEVEGSVRAVVREWEGQLRGVGVQVELDDVRL